MSFKDFYNQFGLKEFPFNTFTTEDETEFSKDLFVSQGEYDPILDSFKRKRNIIILGERGSGKTAILEDFKRHLESQNCPFTTINDYSGLSSEPSNEEIYRLIITNYLIDLFEAIGRRPLKLFKLNKEEKTMLSYFLGTYLPPVTQNLLRDKISKIQVSTLTRIGNKLYRILRGPLNFTGSVAQNMTYQYLLKHYSFLPPIENENQIQEYFPDLKLDVEVEFFDQEISLRLLKRLGDISNKMGFSRPTILIDRLDEDTRFENDADVISKFITPFLTNNNLLSIAEYQIVFFIWSTPFRFIHELVRTQKYYCPNLNWQNSDLEKLLNKRLYTYSGKSLNNYKAVFDDEVTKEDYQEIFSLSNSNPRDLIHIFKTLFEEQYRSEPNSEKISTETINKSLKRFVLEFNYYEYYPRKSNARANSMDIYSYANHLLKLPNEEFTKNQLNDSAGTGSSTNNYVVGMEKIGLIENIGQEKGYATYRIKDPKIIYCLKNNIELKK